MTLGLLSISLAQASRPVPRMEPQGRPLRVWASLALALAVSACGTLGESSATRDSTPPAASPAVSTQSSAPAKPVAAESLPSKPTAPTASQRARPATASASAAVQAPLTKQAASAAPQAPGNQSAKADAQVYLIEGVAFVPAASVAVAARAPKRQGATLQQQQGLASWYGKAFHGRRTANGERFDMHALTAAHPSLPMQSIVAVRHEENGREVIVRINDRGPFVRGRIIDLSFAAAHALRFSGVAKVTVTRLVRVDEIQATDVAEHAAR